MKPELRIKEYEAYRSVYCGLCKELGRSFGPFARLTLNYDFTFLALLHAGVLGQNSCASMQRCVLHPFRKRLCCHSGDTLRFTASAAMLMVYYKNEDNLRDDGFVSRLAARMLRPFTRFVRRRALALHPELDHILGDMMRRQAQVEQDPNAAVDDAADPTAQALAAICRSLSPQPEQMRVLERLGYLLGRWIYLIDALDDLPGDLRAGRFNPFAPLCGGGTPNDEQLAHIREQAAASLRLTHGEITKAFLLLTLYQYEPILENIVLFGLPGELARVLAQKAHA